MKEMGNKQYTLKHDEHGIERNITINEMLAKYPSLNKYNLRRVARGVKGYKSHNGWVKWEEQDHIDYEETTKGPEITGKSDKMKEKEDRLKRKRKEIEAFLNQGKKL